MTDREKVINDLQDAVNDDWMWQHADYYAKAMEDALALIREQHEQLKAQKEVLDALRKVGYPHNFQREEPWIVNYMWAITDVVKKAVRLNNKIIEPPCDEPPKEEDSKEYREYLRQMAEDCIELRKEPPKEVDDEIHSSF